MGQTLPAATAADETAYYKATADTWSKNYPKEYAEVYAYAKNRQSGLTDKAAEAAAPVARPATTACTLSKSDENEIFQNKVSYEKLIQEGKLTEASAVFKKIESLASKCSGGTNSSVVQFAQSCSIAYTRYMAEYNNLTAKNAPMAEITKIKQLIADTEKGENCELETTVEQTVEKHQVLVKKVQEALNFGKDTESVIPANTIPNYCAKNVINGLEEQLKANDAEKLNEIKENIQAILEDGRSNSTIKPVLGYALGIAAQAQTEKNIEQNAAGKEQSAMDNFTRSLAATLDAVLTSK